MKILPGGSPHSAISLFALGNGIIAALHRFSIYPLLKSQVSTSHSRRSSSLSSTTCTNAALRPTCRHHLHPPSSALSAYRGLITLLIETGRQVQVLQRHRRTDLDPPRLKQRSCQTSLLQRLPWKQRATTSIRLELGHLAAPSNPAARLSSINARPVWRWTAT